MNDAAWELRADAVILTALRAEGYLMATSTVAVGDMHIESGESGRAARECFARTWGQAAPLVCGRQVHGTRIETITVASPGFFDQTDGYLVAPGVRCAAGVFTADCLAVAFFDRRRREYVLIHSGWKGTAAGLPGMAVRALEARGTRPADLLVAFSPSIRPCCYEVGDEFADHFPSGPFQSRGGRLFFDNQGAALRQIEDAGVRPEQIFPSPFCTCCDPQGRFWSWRRQGLASGRMMTVLAPLG